MKRAKTKLRCAKCGYRWKEVVYTSSVMSTPPHCPKCARKGIKAVGKPVKIVPLRKRVKNLAKTVLVKPLYYGLGVPLKYSVLKPSLLGLKAGWWSLKMKLFLASLPFRALWWGAKLPYRIVERLLTPPPKVIVLGEEGKGGGGFLGEADPRLASETRYSIWPPGFLEDEDEDECCGNCGEELCGCGGCHCCEDEDEETGFLEEEKAPVSGKTGFAPETSDRGGFAPEASRGGFLT